MNTYGYNDYFSIQDWILVPIYLLLFYFFLHYVKKTWLHGYFEKKFFWSAYFYKVFLTVAYFLLCYYFYGVADALTYFRDARLAGSLINEGRANLFVFLFEDKDMFSKTSGDPMFAGLSESYFFQLKLTYLMSKIACNRYIVTSLLFCTFSFTGILALYKALSIFFVGHDCKLFLFIFFFPTVAMYGSGILKDGVCIGCLGVMLYSFATIMSNPKRLVLKIIIFILSAIIIAKLKSYILILNITFLVLLLLHIWTKKIKYTFLRIAFLPLTIVFLITLYLIFEAPLENMMGKYAVSNILSTITEQQDAYNNETVDQGSRIMLSSFDPSLGGFIKAMPFALSNVFVKPYIWECSNLLMIFSCVESLFLVSFFVYTAFKYGIKKVGLSLFGNPYAFFCFWSSIMMACFIGISTINVGTISRYRIILIPFYLASIISAHTKEKTIATL